jgi:hypothetical protein
MTLEEILKLSNEVVTLEQMEELQKSECVEIVECNGESGKYHGKKWYTVRFNESYIDGKCDDVTEMQVYI